MSEDDNQDLKEKSSVSSSFSSSSTSATKWIEQKQRMDQMLAKLKSDIQEVKSMDKDLTRQFISLGGVINLIKEMDVDQMEFEYDDDDDYDNSNNHEQDDVNEDTNF